MSAVLVLRDPDPERRRRGIQAAESALREFDLPVASAEHGPVAVVWAAFAGAPVSSAPGALMMGDVIPGPGPERLTPAEDARSLGTDGVPPPFDGFHFAATFDAHGGLTVACGT